uniref:Alpha-D-phosphohexomutase alpha/beta/alpha domain-containing protein n=1 Tax=Fagus sylvatica TaxID=28930 RepID=A0A2N9IAU9_FAGSY
MAFTSSPSIYLQGNARKSSFPSSATNKPFHTTLSFSFSLPSSSTKVIRVNSSSSTAKYNKVLVDEEIDNIRRLQNGSDVRGVALEGEKGRTVDLSPPAVEAIAESFGEWVIDGLEKERGGGGAVEDVRVSFGRDPRISGPSLSVAVFDGLSRAGCCVFDMGLATTPACFMSTLLPPFACHASIMMTASHLPYTRNGLKFFTRKGGLTSPEVEEICDKAARKYANRLTKVSTMLTTPPKRVDFMSNYAKHLRDIIKERVNHPLHYDTPLQGFQIVVNAGNGSGGFLTWDILDKLGADTFGSLHLNPDGMFPNHIPNPEDKIAMALTRAAVLENSADLGIVFDTDVDRSGVVDNKGNPINGDKLIALMSAIVLREHPGTNIVTDARTRAYMVVKIIIEMVRMKLAGLDEGIGSLIKDLEEPLESIELRMNIISEPRLAKEKGVQAIETFRSYIEEGRLKGWELDSCGDCWVSEGCLVDSNETPAAIDAHMYRVNVSDEEHSEHGWVHLRQSLHNPNIALNMQSVVPGGCQSMARVLRDQFLMASGMDRILDISEIDNFAKGVRVG